MGTVDRVVDIAALDRSPQPEARSPARIEAGAAAAAKEECQWGTLRCVLFRLGIIYFTLYFLPFPLHMIPWGGYVAGWYQQGMQSAVKWVGEHWMGLEGKILIQPTGSGDTMIEYVRALCFLAVAVAGTIAWSIADRKRAAYPRLHMVFRVYVRLALAGVMLGYGLAKVFPMQFQVPGPDRLLQTYGNSSPMGLLWTFMGYSPAYTMFAGAMETIGALLLLFRRTATLGGLWTAGVMLNVVMLNFCYDVPVKLYSTHLLLAAMIVALPDLPRITRALLLNRDVGPAPRLRFQRRWMNWGMLAAELGVMLLMVVPGLTSANARWKQMSATDKLPALCGLYEVESFELNGEARPPLLTDASRWRRLVVTKWGGVLVQNMADAREGFRLEHNPQAGTVQLTARATGQGEPEKYTLSCVEPEAGTLVLEGPYRGGALKVTLKKSPEAGSPLLSRPFHWIQEMPYNR